MSDINNPVTYGRYTIRAMKVSSGWQARAFRNMNIASQIENANTRDAAILMVKAHLDDASAVERATRGPDGYPTSTTVRAALDQIQMTDGQLNMLNAHLDAPNHTLTATQLSQAAPYRDYQAANIQYGLLGRLLAEEMGWHPDKRNDGTPVWTTALATDANADEAGEGQFRWQLRPQIVHALRP